MRNKVSQTKYEQEIRYEMSERTKNTTHLAKI